MVILMYLIFNKGLFRWRGAPFKKNSYIPLFSVTSTANMPVSNSHATLKPIVASLSQTVQRYAETIKQKLPFIEKATFSGLCTSFFSFCDIKFKLNSIKTIIHRSLHLSSSCIIFHEEINHLRTIFTKKQLSCSHLQFNLTNFLSKQFSDKPQTVDKLSFYHNLPYNDFKVFRIKQFTLFITCGISSH